jgi:hypothetical protein
MEDDYNSNIENNLDNENYIFSQDSKKKFITSPQTINNNNNNSNPNNNNNNNSQEKDNSYNLNIKNNNIKESIIWDLETWKKAEQIKFKAYLKQLEYDFINKLTDQFKIKEEERDKEIKTKITEINTLQTRLKKKATELEGRENKILLMEEELKIKINEVARQLTNKEEEIAYIKKRFREEKLLIEKDSANLNKIISEKNAEIERIEISFKNYKKEIDESPVSLLKAEITRKSLEIDDHIREKDRINHEKDRLKNQCEKLKLDILKIKKLFEQEKEIMYKQKLDEIVRKYKFLLKFFHFS